jgi:hypothetical protein
VIKHIAALKNTTSSELQEKDIVIITMNVLQNAPYKAFLARFAGVVEIDDNATKRAKSTWRKNAVAKIALNVDSLQDRPSDFGRKLKEQFVQDVKESQENEVPVPSKRVISKAYVSKQDSGLAHNKKRKGPAMTKAHGAKKRGGKPVEEDPADFKGTLNNDEALETNKYPAFENDEVKMRKDSFASLKKLDSWKSLEAPVLEMFSFSRLFVDEFTYFKDFEPIFEGIQSESRWILSGTPALGLFADVKMATFLKISLGIDDYSPTPTDDTSKLPSTKSLV